MFCRQTDAPLSSAAARQEARKSRRLTRKAARLTQEELVDIVVLKSVPVKCAVCGAVAGAPPASSAERGGGSQAEPAAEECGGQGSRPDD